MAGNSRKIEDEMKKFEAEISGYSSYPSVQKSMQMHTKSSKPVLYPRQIKSSAQSHVPPPAAVTVKPAMHAQSSVSSQYNLGQNLNVSSMKLDVQNKLKQLKEKIKAPQQLAQIAISQGKASKTMQSSKNYHKNTNKGKDKKLLRVGGGQTWEDSTLADWGDDDFRIFCGDLGNDVTDDGLIKAFNKYPSFSKARVIRDKRTSKSKGYGFVSFKDPADYIKAMKEMNGRYIGSRPIKLKKSNWKNRSLEVVQKKEKEREALINKLNQTP